MLWAQREDSYCVSVSMKHISGSASVVCGDSNWVMCYRRPRMKCTLTSSDGMKLDIGAGRRVLVPPQRTWRVRNKSISSYGKHMGCIEWCSTVGAEPIWQSGSCISPAMPNRGDRIDSANNVQSIEDNIWTKRHLSWCNWLTQTQCFATDKESARLMVPRSKTKTGFLLVYNIDLNGVLIFKKLW